jgi:uncharacterized protein YbjT (DUF2867 family)
VVLAAGAGAGSGAPRKDSADRHGPRADVAAVIAALLDDPGTWRQTLELTGGDTPVTAAVHSTS